MFPWLFLVICSVVIGHIMPKHTHMSAGMVGRVRGYLVAHLEMWWLIEMWWLLEM